MAGSRHHTLPQFLLRGFASRTNNDEAYVYVYRKDKPPFESNIINVSVSRYFYGRQDELSVDGPITDAEGEYATLLQELRATANGLQVHDPRVPGLIAHLAVRTKHVRDSAVESTEFVVGKGLDYLSDPGRLEKLLLKHLRDHPAILEDQVMQFIHANPLAYGVKDKLTKHAAKQFVTVMRQNRSALQSFIAGLRPLYLQKLRLSLEAGHIKSLLKGISPEARVECYRRLLWWVLVSESALILGDSGCLFEVQGGRRFKFIDQKDDELRNVFLPISKDRVVIGTSSCDVPHPNFNEINLATARCSKEYFVASELSPQLDGFGGLLAQDAELMTKEELDHIANTAFAEMLDEPRATECA